MRDLPQTMAMQQLQGSGAGQTSDLPQRLRLNATIPLVMEAADRIEALEAVLREVIVTMRHAHVFITSREKMHPTGVELYDELLTKIAALAPEQDEGQNKQADDELDAMIEEMKRRHEKQP